MAAVGAAFDGLDAADNCGGAFDGGLGLASDGGGGYGLPTGSSDWDAAEAPECAAVDDRGSWGGPAPGLEHLLSAATAAADAAAAWAGGGGGPATAGAAGMCGESSDAWSLPAFGGGASSGGGGAAASYASPVHRPSTGSPAKLPRGGGNGGGGGGKSRGSSPVRALADAAIAGGIEGDIAELERDLRAALGAL